MATKKPTRLQAKRFLVGSAIEPSTGSTGGDLLILTIKYKSNGNWKKEEVKFDLNEPEKVGQLIQNLQQFTE